MDAASVASSLGKHRRSPQPSILSAQDAVADIQLSQMAAEDHVALTPDEDDDGSEGFRDPDLDTASEGDEDDDDPDGAFWLPPFSALPGLHAYMSRLYNRLLLGDVGAARLYVAAHRADVKSRETKKPEYVWVWDAKTLLWKRTAFAAWRHEVAKYVTRRATSVTKHVSKVLSYLADAPKDELKPWHAAKAKAAGACDRFNRIMVMNSVAALVYDLLVDEDFEDTLDATRTLVSFSNGVLDLSTLELRPRTQADALTYALPYPYVADSSTEPMETLINNLLEDGASERVLRTMLGYAFTGRTNKKFFLELVCPRDGGKTTLLRVLKSAMGAYMSLGEIPLVELMESKTEFKNGIAKVLSRKPPPRLMGVDEIKAGARFDEALLNALADGKETTALSFNVKHEDPRILKGPYHAKVFFASNHPIETPATASGLIARKKTVDLTLTFVPEYAPETAAPHHRPRAPDLEAFLLSDAGRPVVAKWLAQGAYDFLQGAPITCPRFEAAAFKLQLAGDPYFEWLADKYVPTGSFANTPAARIALHKIVADYKADNRAPATNAKAWEALKALLATMTDLVKEVSWVPYEGAEVERGYVGLRPRELADLPWLEAAAAARAHLAAM